MLRHVFAFLLSALVLIAAAAGLAAPDSHRVSVELTAAATASFRADGSLPAALAAKAGAAANLRPIFTEPRDPSHREVYYSLRMDRWFVFDTGAQEAKTVARELAVGDGVERVEVVPVDEMPEAVAEKARPAADDPLMDQWHLAKMRVPEAWDLAQGDPQITVAAPGSGCSLGHEDIAPNLRLNSGEDLNLNGIWDDADNNGVDDDLNGFIDDLSGWDFVASVNSSRTLPPGEDAGGRDNNVMPDFDGYGTQCASLAGGATDNGIGISAVGRGVSVLPLRIGYTALDDTGWFGLSSWSYSDDLIASLQYAVDNGVRVFPILYAGTSDYTPRRTAVQYARANGVLVITDGRGTSAQPYYPPAYPEVIAVGASDRADVIRASSGYSSYLDMVAPGIEIWAAISNNSYHPVDYFPTNGVAAMLVSSLAALVWSVDLTMTDDEVEAILRTSCDNIDAQNPGYIGLMGAGRANAFRAVAAAAGDLALVSGSVRQSGPGGQSVAGAQVIVAGTGSYFLSSADGRFSGSLRPGVYDIVVRHPCFGESTRTGVTVGAHDSIVLDFSLVDNRGPLISGTTQAENIDASMPAVISAQITDPSGFTSARLYYTSSSQGGPFAIPMAPAAPGSGVVSGTITAQPTDSWVTYWIEATDSLGYARTDPEDAPWSTYAYHVAEPGRIFVDDFEQDRGWTVNPDGTDTATEGRWVRADPFTVYLTQGTVVMTGDDRTPGAGINCWITGQEPAEGTLVTASNDVDLGTTTLVSPVYDLSGETDAAVSYWRWYTNDLRDYPGTNSWRAQVTADGTHWLDLENTSRSTRAWFRKTFVLTDLIPLTEQIQFRFLATDAVVPGRNTTYVDVEAGVDDFSLDTSPILADATAPVVETVYPAGGEILPYAVPVTVMWTATDDIGVVHARVEVSFDGGASWLRAAEGPLNGSAAIDWTTLIAPPEGVQAPAFWRVIVTDGSGHSDTDICSRRFFVATHLPDDVDADGVADASETAGCLAPGLACFDHDGDGCPDDVISARHIEYWPASRLPLHYSIHENGAPGIGDGSDFTAIQDGFAAWTHVDDAAVRVVYDGVTEQADARALDRVNTVTFRDPDWPFGSGVLAVGLSTSFTTPVWGDDGVVRPGQIVDADMIYNPNRQFSTPTAGSGPDIQSITTHEAGHMLGLSHTAVVSSTMFYVLPPARHAADLEAEDEVAMRGSYPEAGAASAYGTLQGRITSGWTGQPVGGAVVFAIASTTGDTLGCDFTLPVDGSYHFAGLPPGDYWVAIHPLDGSSALGYLGPANINGMVRENTYLEFPAEYWDASESGDDDSAARTAVALAAGGTVDLALTTNIDNDGPRIAALTPTREAVDVPVDATILVRFSEAVDSHSFAGQFRLATTPGGAPVPGTPGLVRDDSTLAYVPRQNLEYSTTYYLALGGQIADRYGNVLATPADSLLASFTTQARPALVVSSLVPREGAAGSVVVVNGDGFDPSPANNLVLLGSTALPVSQCTTRQLVVTVPAGLALGTQQLAVTSGGATSNPLNFNVLALELVPRGLGLAVAQLPSAGRALEVAPAGGRVFVATGAGLSTVDVSVAEAPQVSSLAVTGGLDAVAVSPDGGDIYAIGAEAGVLYRFTGEPLRLVDEIALGATPLGLALDPSGAVAYLPTQGGAIEAWDVRIGSLSYGRQIGEMATTGGSLLGAVAVDPAGEHLLALLGSGRLLVYATANDSLVAELPVDPYVRDVVVDPFGSRAYVSSASGDVTEISLESLSVVREIPTGGSLRGAAVKPTGTYLFAADADLRRLDMIDLRPESPAYRTVAGRVPHGSIPIDLAFAPDGLYAYSLSGDEPTLVVTATGEGPLLTQLTPAAGPVGAQVVLSGNGFAGASVKFNGVTAPILRAGETSLTVTVPAGAASGPVVVRGASAADVSNALGFEVLTPLPGDMRMASVSQPAGAPQLTSVLALAPRGTLAALGGEDGRVFLLDVDPQSTTYNQFIQTTSAMSGAISHLAMAPDGAAVWAVATGDPVARAIDANAADGGLGAVVRSINLGDSDLDCVAVSPSGGELLLARATSPTLHVVDLGSGADTPVDLATALPGLAGGIRAVAIHPAGGHAYLAIGDDEPAAVLVVDLATRTVTGTVTLPSGSPAETPLALSFAPDGSACYVLTSQLSGPPHRTLVRLGTSVVATPGVTAVLPLPGAGGPMDESLQVAPTGSHLLVTLGDGGLQIVDLATLAVTPQASPFPPGTPVDFRYAPDGRRLFVVSRADDSIYGFDFLPAQRLAKVWGANQTGPLGQSLPTPLRVRVADVAEGIGAAGVPVTFTVTDGGGSLSRTAGGAPATTLVVGTNAFGYALVHWTLGSAVGAQHVQVSAVGALDSPAIYAATAVVDPNTLPLTLLTDLLAPADLATEISVTSSIQAKFNRAVDPATVNDATFYLTVAGTDQRVVGVLGLADGNRSASITPFGPLANGTVFELRVGAGIRDSAGGALQNPVQTSFATVPAPTGPAVRSVSKPGAVQGVDLVLSGSGFSPVAAENVVKFNGVAASVVEARRDRLVTRVPVAAASGPLAVEVGGVPSNALPFAVLAPPPAPVDNTVLWLETGSVTRAAVVSPGGDLLYTVAPEADLVKPIDLATLTPRRGIPVGDGPRAVALHPEGSFLYVMNTESNDVSVIDIRPSQPTYNTVTATIHVGTAPLDLAITPDGDRLITVNGGSSDLSVIDTNPSSDNFNEVVARLTTGTTVRAVTVTPDGTRIYVGYDNGYLVLSAVDFGVVRNVATGTAVRSVEVTPDGTLLVMLNSLGAVTLFDIQPGSASEDRVVRRAVTGSAVRSTNVSPDGTLLFAVLENSNQVLVFSLVADRTDGAGKAQEPGVPVDLSQVALVTDSPDPERVSFDPLDPRRFFVARGGDGGVDMYVVAPAAPDPVSEMSVLGQPAGPAAGPTFPLAISWPAATEDTWVSLYRKGFGNYPEYDDGAPGGAVPPTPRDPAEAESAGWTLVAETLESTVVDDPAGRDQWHYAAFARRANGVFSAASQPATGTLNYHLGDVTDGVEPGTGDGRVDIRDISALGSGYGTAAGDAGYQSYLDVGPTVDGTVDSRPLTDNLIDFEDLILFAVNFEVADRSLALPDPAAANRLTVEVPRLPAIGDRFAVVVRMAADGTPQGLSLPLGWNREAARLIGHAQGELLARQGAPTVLLSPREGVFDIALGGARERGLCGEGELLRLDFEVLADLAPEFTVGEITARTRDNAGVAIEAVLQTGPVLPKAFALRPAHPNPFNPETTIGFDVPHPAHVRLLIHDVSGREVATLVDGELQAGVHASIWSGRNSRGARVASGVYFCTLEAGDYRTTRKMMLLK